VHNYKLNEYEMVRLSEIVNSIKNSDWQTFQKLSDEPFLDIDVMRETFLATAPKVDWSSVPPIEEVNVTETVDGVRYIAVSLRNKSVGALPISLDIVSKPLFQQISIQLFFEPSDWS